MPNGEDKTTISSYGKSSIISMIDSCSSSGDSVSSGGDKNDAGKGTARFGG